MTIEDNIIDLTDTFDPIPRLNSLTPEEIEFIGNLAVRCHNTFNKVFLYKKAEEIIPGLWVGGEESALHLGFLEENKINTIINMAKELDDPPTFSYIKRIKIGIEDGWYCPKKVFSTAANLIHQERSQGKVVLVHCMAGVSRSITAVLAYLIKYENMTPKDAAELIFSKREVAAPSPKVVTSCLLDLRLEGKDDDK